MDRRSMLLAGLAAIGGGIAARLLANTGTAAAAEEITFEVAYTEAEWRQRLSPEQFRILRQHGTEHAGSSPSTRSMAPVRTSARAATYRCIRRKPNTTAVPDGPVSGRPSKAPSAHPRTERCSLHGPKFIAAAAAAISATCSKTAPRQPASATA